MQKQGYIIFRYSILCIFVLMVVHHAKSIASKETGNTISGYRAWTKINLRPVKMDRATARACNIVLEEYNSIHREKYITVYVNDIGKKSMMSERYPKFPLGSIIVKEKLNEANSSTPELLTVMIKREEGFDQTNGNWEYAVYDGVGVKEQASGRLENCQDCHISRKDTDYIFRESWGEREGKIISLKFIEGIHFPPRSAA
ncbi:MAG: cytochrome P460 family protein [Acidobacteriota bacterium]